MGKCRAERKTMTIETRTEIGHRVKIIAMEGTSGRVLSFFYGQNGLQYYVRYFHNGDEKQVYFFEDELEFVDMVVKIKEN